MGRRPRTRKTESAKEPVKSPALFALPASDHIAVEWSSGGGVPIHIPWIVRCLPRRLCLFVSLAS